MSPCNLRRIVPTLLALGLLPSAWAAVGPAERDNHLAAVIGLIERDYRLPAQGQIADFHKAGYPEAAWHGKFLTWYHADRFRILAPDKAEQARLTAIAATLDGELTAASQAGKLPPDLVLKRSASGQVLRLVNDLLRVVGQDQPTDRLALVDEQKAAAEASTRALITAATAAWQASLTRVQANSGSEAEWQGLPEKDPRWEKLARGAVELRFEAVRTAWLASKALREVAERGQDFGIDSSAATAFLKDFAKRNFALLQEWDLLWGDFHPYLRAYTLDLAGQGARFKVAGSIAEDVANDLRGILDLDVARDPAIAEELRTLQARSWGGYLAWCREMGRDVSPQWYQTGLAAFAEFKERTRNDRHFRLDHADPERAAEVARVYFQGGRLLERKDPAAAAVAFAVVAGVRGNPLARRAAAWLAARPGGDPPSAAWASQPVAEDPAFALVQANALRRQAEASGDTARQRAALLDASVALRNGVLGLACAAYAESADEAAPELWFRYAECLSRLGMRWQAALVAQAGLRHIDRRMKALPGRTPWLDKAGAWTASGRYVSLLARNAVAYATNLMVAGRGAAVTRLYDEAVSLLVAVSPGDGGRNLERSLIQIVIQEGDFPRALELIDAYARKHPEAFYDAASLRTSAYTAWLAKITDPAQRKAVAARALQACAEVAKREPPPTQDPAASMEREQVQRDALALQVAIALGDGDTEQVLTLLGPDYWRSAPADPVKAAQMLGQLCTALRQWYEIRTREPAGRGDAGLLIAAWPRVQAVHGIWREQQTRLVGQEERVARQGAQIAWVFDLIANVQIPAMRRQPGAPPELADIGTAAGRAFADLIEPTITEASRPELVLQVGAVLWDLGEHARACRLLRLSLTRLDADPDLAALRDTPKEVLQPLDAILRARPELRGRWAEVVDLLYDDPGLHGAIRGGLPESAWRERKRDYLAAGVELAALRAEVTRSRMALGADFARLDQGLARLTAQVRQLDDGIVVMSRLAEGLCEQGEQAKARLLYNRLLDYDPGNLGYIAASVELTIAAFKTGTVDDAELTAARLSAVRARDAAPACSPEYWTAAIQVHELSVALKEVQLVDQRLRFDPIVGSTPAEDLQLRPRQPRDDLRVRRAGNAQAVALCQRYLALFAQPGITAKPGFAIGEIEIAGRPTTLFLPVGAPAFTVVSRQLADGTAVEFICEEGRTPPPEPGAGSP